MQAKTTRAFRTISEAAEELDLQPHVLRFWESKFPNFKPIKRGGGRRFYRPEDIEFLRGIKVLLHDERHPIKDVQKLIRSKGISSVVTLGRSVEKAAIPKDVKDTVLVPERIRASDTPKTKATQAQSMDNEADEFTDEAFFPENIAPVEPVAEDAENTEPAYVTTVVEKGLSEQDRHDLEAHLQRLIKLRDRWGEFSRDVAS